MNTHPIIVIEDDEDDIELIQQAFKELKIENEIIVFNNAHKFLEFIKNSDKVFLIMCDINMSPIDGLELKKIVYDDEILRLKCVPFIFMSTSSASFSVMRAYSFGVQGYFIKPTSFEKMKDVLYRIVEYWKHSQHPNL